MRHKQKRSAPGEPLLKSVTESLTQLEHQIWLLRNVFWWYLLPILVGLCAVIAQIIWIREEIRAHEGGEMANIIALGTIPVFILTCGLVYWINQRAVRKQLAPRRQELKSLLTSLKPEKLS
jgi:heme/copper-type cytochrome/quinol oxidase subunit 2